MSLLHVGCRKFLLNFLHIKFSFNKSNFYGALSKIFGNRIGCLLRILNILARILERLLERNTLKLVGDKMMKWGMIGDMKCLLCHHTGHWM
jgi:hypothetical protein